jgi:hypothetical protein
MRLIPKRPPSTMENPMPLQPGDRVRLAGQEWTVTAARECDSPTCAEHSYDLTPTDRANRKLRAVHGSELTPLDDRRALPASRS